MIPAEERRNTRFCEEAGKFAELQGGSVGVTLSKMAPMPESESPAHMHEMRCQEPTHSTQERWSLRSALALRRPWDIRPHFSKDKMERQ